jgi:tetratricopeptide (TPR) repeat protein/DNA-binding CsgD family transcriptional regulator
MSKSKKETKPDSFFRKDPPPNIKAVLTKAIARHQAQGSQSKLMKAQLQLALTELYLGDNTAATSLLDACEKYHLKYGSYEEKGMALFIRGTLLKNNGEFEEALRFSIRAIQHFQHTDLHTKIILCWTLCGIICRNLSLYNEGIEYFNKAIDLAQKEANSDLVLKVMHNMLEIKVAVFSHEENAKDINAFLEYVRTVNHNQDSIYEIMTLWNLSAICLDMKQTAQARQAYTQAAEMRHRMGPDRYDLAFVVRLAEVCAAEGNEPEMLKQSELALQAAINQKELLFEMEVYVLRFSFYLAAKNLLKAKENLDTVTTLLEKKSPSQIVKFLNEYHVSYYKAAGDWEQLAHYLEAGKKYQVEIHQNLATQRLKHATAIHELEIKEKENEMMKSELNHKNQELNLSNHYLQQRNEMLTDLKDCINGLKRENAQKEVVFQTLFKRIDVAFNKEESDHHIFKEKFDQTHSAYIHAVSKRYPQLSPSECRICALLHSGFSTKDISTLTSTTKRNIESHRLNIRKKIGLSRSQNLQTILASIKV